MYRTDVRAAIVASIVTMAVVFLYSRIKEIDVDGIVFARLVLTACATAAIFAMAAFMATRIHRSGSDGDDNTA